VKIAELDELTIEEEKIFTLKNYFQQLELFPLISADEILNTLYLLKRFREMELHVRDFEKYESDFVKTAIEGESARRISNEEYYANKTANAVILVEKQQLIYREYKSIIQHIERANGITVDNDARQAVHYRYMKGYSYKESLLFFSKTMSNRTFDRKLAAGIISIANTLKLRGILEREWKH
jgi:hypothetical protein